MVSNELCFFQVCRTPNKQYYISGILWERYGQIAVGCTTLLGAWATGINFIVDKKVEPVNQNIKRLDDCVKKLDNKIETSVQKLDNKIETSVKRLDNRIDQLGLKLDY